MMFSSREEKRRSMRKLERIVNNAYTDGYVPNGLKVVDIGELNDMYYRLLSTHYAYTNNSIIGWLMKKIGFEVYEWGIGWKVCN